MVAAIALLVALLLASAVFSGSETGVYTVSRLRIDAEARAGKWSARLLRTLLRSDAGILVTLLIGNNLMLELLTHWFEREVVGESIPSGTRELVITLTLTPIVFLFGELLPKDFFRRRPYRLLVCVGPLLALVRIATLPLALPLQALSFLLQRIFGIRPDRMTRALRREAMAEVLNEGIQSGALPRRAQSLVHNVLVLRETPVSSVMVPWDRATVVDLDRPQAEARAVVEASDFTRVPAVRSGAGKEDGRLVAGYVHQLDVLGRGGDVADALREIPRLEPETPVDQALARLRLSGQRLAIVGRWDAPVGLVTLMDLLDEISRESKVRVSDRALLQAGV